MALHEAAVAEIDGAIARVLLEDRHESAQIYSTHHNTMVCTAYLLLERAGISLPPKLWAFDNGTVIELCGEIDGGCRIRMIHPKEVSNPDRFTSPEVFNTTMSKSSHKHLKFPQDATACFLRHGVCAHNDSKATIEEAHDGLLTELGRVQVGNACIVIATGLEKYDNIDLTTYCSDLQRSMESIEILHDNLSSKLQQPPCCMCIESRERTRAIGTDQQWQDVNCLRGIAIDPYLEIDQYSPLFPPGTLPAAMKRSLVENLPRSPIKEPVTHFGDLAIDSRDYVTKVQEAEARGETFGDAASRIQFLDVVIQNAQRAKQAQP